MFILHISYKIIELPHLNRTQLGIIEAQHQVVRNSNLLGKVYKLKLLF